MKVLILTIKLGMGHFTAAKSLSQQIQTQFPNAEIDVLDICEYIIPKFSSTIYEYYNMFVNKGSKIYNMLYKHSEKNESDMKTLIPDHFLNKINDLIEDIQPSVIISTCSISSQLISAYKENFNKEIPFITCITDISFHPSWINPYTDYYLVATSSVKEGLMKRGINPNTICVNGIPVKEDFKQIRHDLHLERDKHLLIMGGGLGMLPSKSSFYRELNEMKNVKTTIIVGKNEKLYEKINGKYQNINVIGFTENVAAYVQEATLIITKPGGITVFECIVSEVPILLFEASLQQEVKNQKYIVDYGIGKILDSIDFTGEIYKLIHDDETLSKIRSNMRELKKEFNQSMFCKILLSIHYSNQVINE